MKSFKKICIMIIVSTLMVCMVTATAYAVSTPKSVDKKDDGIVKIESKEKTTKYKITWNGNGGKIGSKKTVTTTVKKGSKIGKLVTPKRSGYSFKGWYTKKTGGTKISKSTKPKRSATLYARWTKKPSSRVLNAEEKKLVGAWVYGPNWGLTKVLGFFSDRTFSYSSMGSSNQYGEKSESRYHGNYQVKNGKIYLTNTVVATKRLYANPPFIFSKNDYEARSNGNSRYEWCVEHGNCLIVMNDLFPYTSEDHFKRANLNDYKLNFKK